MDVNQTHGVGEVVKPGPRFLVPGVLVLTILVPCTLFGHHSFFGRFDTETFVEMEADIVEVFWRNPHAYVIIETTEEDGGRVTWELETSSPTVLARSGIGPDSMSVGDHVRVAGFPSVTGRNEIFLTNILVPSGEEMILRRNVELRWAGAKTGDDSFLFQTEGDSSRPDLGIYRVWSHTNVIPFLFPEATDLTFSVNDYPMTEAARAALQGFDRARDNPTANCAPKGMPTIMEQPNPMEVVQDGNDILLRIEEYDTLRTIHLDPGAVPADEPVSLLGYSLGRWDGTTLVVTTTRINWPYFNQLGIPQSEESVLVERFSPTEDGSQLDYELTVTDPVNFTEPVSLGKHWLYLPDQEVLPYDCTLRN